MSLIVKKILTCFALSAFILATSNPMSGQEVAQLPPEGAVRAQPPMKNVFLNVLWGSLSGGFVLMGWSTLDDSVSADERYKFSRLSNQFLVGATYGGILGMLAGVYFSVRGITFDQDLSRIALYPDYTGNPEGQWFFATSPSLRDENRVNLLNLHFKF